MTRVLGISLVASLFGCASTTPRNVFYVNEKAVRAKVKEVALAKVYWEGIEAGREDAQSLGLIRRAIWAHLRTVFKVRDAGTEDVSTLVQPYLTFTATDGASVTLALKDRLTFAGGFPEKVAGGLCGETSDAVFLPIVMEGVGYQEAKQRWSAAKGASEEHSASGPQPALLLLGVLVDCAGGVAWAEGIFLGYLTSFSAGYVTGGIDQKAASVSEILAPGRRRDHQQRVASLMSSLTRKRDPHPGDME